MVKHAKGSIPNFGFFKYDKEKERCYVPDTCVSRPLILLTNYKIYFKDARAFGNYIF